MYAPMNPPMKLTGQEHGKERKGGGDNGAEHLARAAKHGFFQAEAHDEVALHVLRDDDRVIHHDPDGGDQREQ